MKKVTLKSLGERCDETGKTVMLFHESTLSRISILEKRIAALEKSASEKPHQQAIVLGSTYWKEVNL